MRMAVGFALVAVLAAGLASGAAGKAPPDGIEICGQSGCRAIPAERAELVVIRALYGSASDAAAPAPFFLVRWQWPDRPEQRAWWVPKGGLVRGVNGQWMSQSVASEALLREAASGLEPFPVPIVTRVLVGGRVAENPRSYLRLLDGGESASVTAFERSRGWLPVRVASLDASPWTNGATIVQLSRAGHWVWRDGLVYAVSPRLAQRARQGRSLAPFSRAG